MGNQGGIGNKAHLPVIPRIAVIIRHHPKPMDSGGGGHQGQPSPPSVPARRRWRLSVLPVAVFVSLGGQISRLLQQQPRSRTQAERRGRSAAHGRSAAPGAPRARGHAVPWAKRDSGRNVEDVTLHRCPLTSTHQSTQSRRGRGAHARRPVTAAAIAARLTKADTLIFVIPN